MKLRDDTELVAEAAALVTYACGPFGSMYTAEDIACRILDAIDRRTPTAPPEPPCNCECCPRCLGLRQPKQLASCGHPVYRNGQNCTQDACPNGAYIEVNPEPGCPVYDQTACIGGKYCPHRAATPGTAPTPPSEPKP
jgi:hypothetical protein